MPTGRPAGTSHSKAFYKSRIKASSQNAQRRSAASNKARSIAVSRAAAAHGHGSFEHRKAIVSRLMKAGVRAHPVNSGNFSTRRLVNLNAALDRRSARTRVTAANVIRGAGGRLAGTRPRGGIRRGNS